MKLNTVVKWIGIIISGIAGLILTSGLPLHDLVVDGILIKEAETNWGIIILAVVIWVIGLTLAIKSHSISDDAKLSIRNID